MVIELLNTNSEEVNRIYDFVRQFPLDYPDYFVWLEKCKRELELGYKKAIYSTNFDGRIIGSAIFQPHKQEKGVLELKNLRVDSSCEQQGIGSLLISSMELYAQEKRFKRILVDTHQGNLGIEFLQKRGYNIEAQESLYTAQKEVILCKDI